MQVVYLHIASNGFVIGQNWSEFKSSSGDAFPRFDAHKGKVAAMAQQRPFQLTLA